MMDWIDWHAMGQVIGPYSMLAGGVLAIIVLACWLAGGDGE